MRPFLHVASHQRLEYKLHLMLVSLKQLIPNGLTDFMKRYVINLDRSVERLNSIKSVFEQAQLDFIRVSAVDGKLLPEEDYLRLTKVRNWPKKLSHSEVACFLSHLQCLKLIAEGDDPYGAVFEDDIKLSPNAKPFLEDWSWIPKGFDVIKLDTAEIMCVLGRFDISLDNGYQLAPLISKHYCTGGYIISKECAKKVYDNNTQVTAPFDEILYNPDCWDSKAAKVEQLFPAIVVQIGLESTIRAPEPENEKHKPSNRPFLQKVYREFNRAKKRYIMPWLMKTFLRYYWGIVPFK